MRPLVTLLALFAFAWPAGAQPIPDAEQPEIIVEGRRESERYRLPPELRTLPAERDGKLSGSNPDLACQNVGPRGCGTKLMPILTVRADGRIVVGAEGEKR